MVSDEQLIQDLEAFAEELGETPTARQMNENGPWSANTYQRHFGSWNNAIKQSSMSIIKEKPSLSNEEIIQGLQDLADELDETPTGEQMDEIGPYSVKAYRNHFGSWNEAVKEADLDAVREYPDSKEEMLNDLRDFADQINQTPTFKQMKENGPWDSCTYTTYFGSWNKALKEAGLDTNIEQSESKEQLIEDLRDFADEIGKTPSQKKMKSDGPWSETVYQYQFGSWNQALKEAGLDTIHEHSESKEQLIEDLRDFADEIGRTPSRKKMNSDGPWSDSTYRYHFGDWNEALREAELEPVRKHADSKQELIEDLQEFADEIGETPTYKHIYEKGPWGTSTYARYFGSWNEALREAGLEPVQRYVDSKQELIEDLQEFADELGETPTEKQMEEDGPWGANTYRKHFGSWNEALKKAGLEPIRQYPVEPEWDDDVEDYYGESWTEMREKAIQRDNEQCRVCGDDELIHVHHIEPRRCFENPDESNTLDNLITLCPSCHGRFENRWTDTDPDEFEAKARELLSVA